MTLDLWLAQEPPGWPPAVLARWAALLSVDERARWQRFAREEDRCRFLLARALVRTVLARRLGCEPASLVFSADAHGKPRLQHPSGTALQFNLSHTRGLCALVLGSGAELGVDVENFDREVEVLALARRFFATPEVLALEALAPRPQRELFFALWTLKEAWVKAKGLGLRVPLDEFSFHGPGLLQDGRADCLAVGTAAVDAVADGIQLHCDPQLLETPAAWSFRLLRQGHHRMAVAAALPAASPLQLTLHDASALLQL